MAKQKSDKKVSSQATKTSHKLPPPHLLATPKDNAQSYQKLAIVIASYNIPIVYLKKCIESVLNQTNPNLELIFVENGSTKKEARAVIYDYAKQDSRITILQKEVNHCLSAGLNAAILYLKDAYALEFSTKDSTDTLACFEITNANPYGVKLYKSKDSFKHDSKTHSQSDFILNAPKVSHIAFMDSDDFWKPNFLETCFDAIGNADIAWCNSDTFYEHSGIPQDYKSTLELLHFHAEPSQVITPKDFFERMIALNFRAFWWSWCGIINFEFFDSAYISLIPQSTHDDNNFGILLFLQARKIRTIPEPIYTRTLRSGSGSNYDGKYYKEQIPGFFQNVLSALNDDVHLTQEVFRYVGGYFVGYLELRDFIANHPNFPNIDLMQRAVMSFYSNMYLNFLFLDHSKSVDTDTYFTICFNIIFHLLENFKKGAYAIEPFKDLGDPRVIKTKERARAIQFAKDMLYLENSHIVRLNQEKQALQNALVQAQERIKMLESMLVK